MSDNPKISALFKLTPKEAVAYLQGRDQITPTFNWQDLWQDEHAQQFTVSRLARLDILESLRDGITASVQGDLSRRDWTKNAEQLLQKEGWWGVKQVVDPATGEILTTKFNPARLKLIYDTNTRMAYAAGQWQRIARNKATHPYVRYITKRDEKVRHSHRLWDNLTLPVDHPFWRTHFPPNGWRCFPAGVEVRADAQLGLKTWYTGKMVQFKTRLGHSLTTTANHPVLTRRGWLPASHLQKGDQLLCDSSVINSALVGIVHNEQPPSRVENLFEALSAQGFRIVPMAANDFHGDALLRKPEIHVTGADCHLMDEIEATQQQFIGERNLGNTYRDLVMKADISMRAPQCGATIGDAVYAQDTTDIAVAGVELPGDGAFGNNSTAINGKNAALQVGIAVSSSRPGCAELTLHPARIGFDDAPLGALSITAPAQGNFVEAEQAPQDIAATFGLFSQLLEANAGLVAADDIVEIGQFNFAGHVFDFQTETGLIVAGGVVVHNCRCSTVSISQAEYDKGLSPNGQTLNKTAPEIKTRDWVNKRTGAVERVPEGIDPGFAYNPGARGSPHRGGEPIGLPFTGGMAQARQANLANVQSDKIAGASARLGAAAAATMTDAERLARYAAWEVFVGAARTEGRPVGTALVVGFLDAATLDWLAARDKMPQTAGVVLQDNLLVGVKEKRHQAVGDALTTAEWIGLAAMFDSPEQVLWDSVAQNVVVVMPSMTDPRKIKIAINLDMRIKTPEGKRAVNSARTVFKVGASVFKNKTRYEKVR